MYPLVELVPGIAFTKAVSHIGFSLSMEGGDHGQFYISPFEQLCKVASSVISLI